MTRDRTLVLTEGQVDRLESAEPGELACAHCGDPLAGEATEVGPEDILSAEEVNLLQRADKGILPCPWCDLPLKGEFVYYELEGDDFYAGVRLSCGCGFVEY